MPTRTLVAALAAALLAACAGTPMHRDLLRRHTERNCRVRSTMAPAYSVDSTGVDTRNTAYVRCLRSAGFEPRKPAIASREA